MFRTVASIAGTSISKIPDGETDERQRWILALIPRLREVPQLTERAIPTGYVAKPTFDVAPGVGPADIDVPALGYAAAARHAYPIFCRLRDEDGAIPAGTRFQVSLPTVTAGCAPFIAPQDQARFEPAYARALRREVDEIIAAVPHGDLAMQWDVAVEMAIVEGMLPSEDDDPLPGVAERLAELSGWVPADIPLGYHLCYGDAQQVPGHGEGRHLKEPEDMSKLVAMANAVTCSALRQLAWFSMPVPIARNDDAYFEPLEDLRLQTSVRLYLGLVHHQDGVDGTQRRIDTAKRHYREFGVATECGMGRKPTSLIPKLLHIQAAVAV